MENSLPQNKMATAPVGRLMIGMGMPMILSMVLQAFYNIVDSYFVSAMPDTAGVVGMGEYGVNALTLAFPVQMLMIAVGVGTGVGINALLSRCLGQGDGQKASQIAGNAIFLGICTYVVFLVLGLVGIEGYLGSQTSDPVVMELGMDYLRICMLLSFGGILFMIYEKLLQSTGRTGLCTIAQLVGAGLNIVLDPILIFGYFGCPAMGVRGAAWATVIGQIASLLLGVVFHCAYNKDVSAHVRYLRPNGAVIKEIYLIGIPAIVMQALMSFMTYGVNIIFGAVSTAAVTAYGVYYKIQQFVFFAAFGMNNALIPIIAFNYGRGDQGRMKAGIRFGMLYTLAIMLVGAVGLHVFAGQLVGVFALSAGTQALCIRAIRCITLGYLFVGANIAFQGIFQAFGGGMRSLCVSMIRLVVVALPLAWIFARFPNAEQLIWWAFPIAEGCALVVALMLMKQVSSRFLSSAVHEERHAA